MTGSEISVCTAISQIDCTGVWVDVPVVTHYGSSWLELFLAEFFQEHLGEKRLLAQNLDLWDPLKAGL